MSELNLNQIDFGEPDVSRERETLAFRKVLDQLSELISVRVTEPLLFIDELVTVQPLPQPTGLIFHLIPALVAE